MERGRKINLRLHEIWELFPGNHMCCLAVKDAKTGQEYHELTQLFREGCPYYRQYAVVKSVYAITREIIEIYIWENMPT